MKQNNRIILALSIFALSACSHGDLDKKIDDQVAAESNVKTREDVRVEIGKLISTTPGLSDDQRSKLSQLAATTAAQSDALRNLANRLRAVLIKNLLADHGDREEAELIKSRIRETEIKRLDLSLAAVEQADAIVGRTAAVRRHLDEQFLFGKTE